jgi:predicted Zn-dependent protease
MKKLPWFLFLLATALVSWLSLSYLRQVEHTSRSHLATARRLASQAPRDFSSALQELELAFQQADPSRDADLVVEILLERAKVFEELKAYQRARGTLQLLVETHRPGDLALETRLAGLELESGAVDSARERLDRILSLDPERADAWAWLGRMRARESARAIADCEAVVSKHLGGERRDRALTAVRRAAARDLPANKRRAVLYELLTLLGQDSERVLRPLMASLARAGSAGQGALEAFAHGFLAREAPLPAVEFIESLRAAERLDLAGEIALASTRLLTARAQPRFHISLLSVLREDEKAQLGAELILSGLPMGVEPTLDLLREWNRTYYGAGAWSELVNAALPWLNVAPVEDRTTPQFYLGVALHQLEQWEAAAAPTWNYLGRKGLLVRVEEEPGCVALCYELLARGYRARGSKADERMALERFLTAVDPPRTPADRLRQAEAWTRLGRLRMEAGPHQSLEAEADFSRALCLWPQDVARVESEWLQAGELALQQGRIDLDGLFADLLQSKRLVPVEDTCAFLLTRLGRLHLSRREPFAAGAVCLRILDRFPDFPPGIDLAIEVARATGDRERLLELLLRKAELGGATQEEWSELRAQGDSQWTRDTRRRMVQLDPEQFGQRQAAVSLARSGQSERALQRLRTLDRAQLDPETLLLGARLAYQLARWDEVDQLTAAFPRSSPQWDRAQRLRLEAALQAGDAAKAAELIVEWVEHPPEQSTAALQPLLDRWLASGEVEIAQRLLRAWERDPALRDGWLLLRAAQSTWLEDGASAAQSALERTAAYSPPASVALGKLLLAGEQERWTDLPSLADALKATLPQRSPLQGLCLDMLQVRLPQAAERLAKSSAAAASDPHWQLAALAYERLRTSAGEVSAVASLTAREQEAAVALLDDLGDPRRLLTRLLALEDEQWTAWLAASAGRSAAEHTSAELWWQYLRARALTRIGQPAAVQGCAQAMLKLEPSSRAAWDLLEQAFEQQLEQLELDSDPLGLLRGHPLAEQLQVVRRSRREQFRVPDDQDAFALWQGARAAFEAEQYARAAELCESALELDGDYAEGLLLLARARLAQDRYENALRALERGGQARARGGRPEWIAAACLLAKQLADHVDGARLWLEHLSTQFADDPLPVIALAALDLRQPDEGLTYLSSALERMQRFRERHANLPIEALRPGAAAIWGQVLRTFAPVEAEAFARQELLVDPASPDLWLLLAQVQEERGDRAGSREALTTAVRLETSGEPARAYALSLAETGRDSLRIQSLRLRVAEIEGRERAGDLTLGYAAARSEMLAGPHARDAAIEMLEELWKRRAEPAVFFSPLRIAQTLGALLCLRDDEADRKRAVELMRAALAEADDPLDRTVLMALAGIASAR